MISRSPSLVIRRTHMYLALFLFPWMLMYAVSTMAMNQQGFLQRSWSVVVDLVCLAIVVWIATGLYMWWGVPASRRWGWAAICAGTASFLVLAMRL